MKKLLGLITVLSLLTFTSKAQDGKTVVKDANAVERSLSGSFNAITVQDGIDVYLSQGEEESVAVSASDEKFMDRFKTEVNNGVLKIWFDNKSINWGINERRKLKAYVSFKTLIKLSASGGASVNGNGVLNVDLLEIKCTSGSHFGAAINAATLTTDQSSGSDINISGKAERLNASVSSGAVFKGYGLAVDYCDAKASSGGGIRITINKELNAKANSAGGIHYKGDAVVKNVSVNSGGVVKKA